MERPRLARPSPSSASPLLYSSVPLCSFFFSSPLFFHPLLLLSPPPCGCHHHQWCALSSGETEKRNDKTTRPCWSVGQLQGGGWEREKGRRCFNSVQLGGRRDGTVVVAVVGRASDPVRGGRESGSVRRRVGSGARAGSSSSHKEHITPPGPREGGGWWRERWWRRGCCRGHNKQEKHAHVRESKPRRGMKIARMKDTH